MTLNTIQRTLFQVSDHYYESQSLSHSQKSGIQEACLASGAAYLRSFYWSNLLVFGAFSSLAAVDSGAQLSDINYNWCTAMHHSGVVCST